MKNKILIMTTLCSLVAFSQTQWISPTGALDAFADGSASTPEVDPVTEETSLMAWDSENSKALPTQHAFRGIYWSQSDGTDTSLVYKSQYERPGTGKLTYKLTQEEGATKPIRVSFGEYADSATATKSRPFTLDLSQNSKLELKFTNEFLEDLMVSLKLKDINDITLQTYNEYLDDPDDSSLYKYPIRSFISKSALEETSFVVDFSQTNGSEYIFSPLSEHGCHDLPLRKNTKQTGFDFTQVKYVDIIVNNIAMKSPEECYDFEALTDAYLVFTGFKLGALGVVTSTNGSEVFNDPSNVAVTVYDMMGMKVAHGSLGEIHLKNGLYIVKSENKTTKLLIKN